MTLQDTRLKQTRLITTEINKLLDLLYQTEQNRDVTSNPTERANYELQIETHKSLINRYKAELEQVENEIEVEKKTSSSSKKQFKSYRVNLDESLSNDELDKYFAEEAKSLLDLMDYEISRDAISGISTLSPPTFITTQDGDFEPLKTLFQCIYGIVEETTVVNFNGIYELNRKNLALNFAVIVTNTYIAPNARSLASQYQIQLLTYEDLLNTVFKVTRYLKTKTQDYEHNNKLYRTYVEVKYLRKGKGKFKDNQATSDEFLVTESYDGNNFEAKGDLTTYVDSWLLSEGNSQICLLGEYGTGKTSFATHYFYKQAISYLNNPGRSRIPLLITLNRYHKSADIGQMITDFLVNECGIRRNFDTFLKLAARGKLLIILDGFDEMAKQVDVNIRRHNFKEITRLLIGDNKVILSGRPNYFLNQSEIAEIFNQEATTNDPYKIALKKSTSEDKIQQYEILSVTLFDRWQIEEFLKKQSEYLKSKGINDWRELQKTIYETYNLEELARTPVLLEIIIKTISEIRGKVAHINAAKLYEIYTDFWLDREYDEKGEIRWLVTRKEKELFVLELAWTMLLTDNLNPEIHFSQLSERVRSYFSLEKASEIEYFSSDIRFCSYLIHSESDGSYKFIHKSFMEYFSARRIYRALFNEKDILPIVTDKSLPNEVFFFLCQIVQSNEIDLLQQLSKEEKDERNKDFIIALTIKILQQSINIYERRGTIQSVMHWANKLLQYSKELEIDNGYLWGLIAKGKSEVQLGKYNEAEESFVEALVLSQKLEDKSNESQSLIQLGTVYESRGEFHKALETYQNSLIIFQEIDDKTNTGKTLTNIGSIYESRGELDRSLEYYKHSLSIFQKIGDKTNIGGSLMNIGSVLNYQAKYSEALELEQQALAIFRELGDRRNECLALSQIGNTYQTLRQYDEANLTYQAALEITQEIGDLQGQSRMLSNIGNIFFEMRIYDEAESSYNQAIKISENLGYLQGVADNLSNIGKVYRETRRFEDSITIYKESISILEKLGSKHDVGTNFYNLANVYVLQNDILTAITLYKKSLIIFEEIGELYSISKVKHLIGKLLQKTGEFEQAEIFYNEALEMNIEIGNQVNIPDLLESLGDLAKDKRNLINSESFYKRALEQANILNNSFKEVDLLIKLARLAKITEDIQMEVKYYKEYLNTMKRVGLEIPEDIKNEYSHLIIQGLIPYDGREKIDNFREQELIEIQERIQKLRNVLVLGIRGVGKTTLLRVLLSQLNYPFIPVFIDLQILPKQAESLLNGILRQIIKTLSKKELIDSKQWEKFSLTYASEFTEAIESMLNEVGEKFEDIRIVLLLDEAERLFEGGEQVPGIIRHTLMANHDVVAVLSGSKQILNLSSKSLTSPLLDIFETLTLEPLSK